METLANSEDSDKMPQVAAFHHGLTVCKEKNYIQGKKHNRIWKSTKTYELSICLVDHSAFKSVLASDNFCHQLLTFVNSLDPDQNQQNISPDLDSDSVPLKTF